MKCFKKLSDLFPSLPGRSPESSLALALVEEETRERYMVKCSETDVACGCVYVRVRGESLACTTTDDTLAHSSEVKL